MLGGEVVERRLFVRRAHNGRMADVKRIRSPSLVPARSPTFTRETSTAPIPVCLDHPREKRLGFHLDSLRKQLPGPRSQDIRQWIVDIVGLTQ